MQQAADETLPAFSEAVDTAKESVTRFTDDGIIPMQKAEDEAKESADNLKSAIVQLANTLSAKLVTVMAFKAGVELMTASINAATSAVDALRAALEAIDGKHYTAYVDVVKTGEIPGGAESGGGGQGGGATGGLITGPRPAQYYAKGGWVFMKPKGTDTVPAMLTPGEYVLRKDAVDKLGVPFLRRLNRLDIAGAFDALMSRVYKPNLAAMAAYSTTYNRYDNRNYTVKQDIHTNNPDYSYRVASRFAHAL